MKIESETTLKGARLWQSTSGSELMSFSLTLSQLRQSGHDHADHVAESEFEGNIKMHQFQAKYHIA